VTEPSARLAGAPITWGVCEVSGWGFQLGSERVLAEMSSLGLRATELGPEGYLPDDPEDLCDLLDRHGLRLVGGFVPAVLHRRDELEEGLARVIRSADLLQRAGAGVLVLAADTPGAGYETPSGIDDSEWAALMSGIDRAVGLGAERGLTVALHPHQGTVVAGAGDVERLLETSSVALCLDTGHLMVGGAVPLQVVETAPDRVAHVHLKDVDAGLAAQVRAGRVGYHQAVRGGMYRPLGRGDADIAGIVALLERTGYRGWYVLEQDTVLEDRPMDGRGPIRDAEASLEFLVRVLDGLAPDSGGRDQWIRAPQEASPEEREGVGR
jgi:inosose dehydratase